MRFIIFIGIVLCINNYLQSQTWVGAGDGISWSDKDNWSPNTIPGPGSIVTIATDSVVVQEGQAALFDSITLTGLNAVLTIVKGASAEGKSIVLTKSARFYNKGNVILLEGRSVGIDCDINCRVTNSNNILIAGVQGVHVQNKGDFYNLADAVLHTQNTEKIQNSIINNGTFINHGEITSFNMNTAIINNMQFSNYGLIEGSRLNYGINGIGSFMNSNNISLNMISIRGITANGQSTWVNNGTINVNLVNTSQSLLIFTTYFINNGTINISNGGSPAMNIGSAGVFDNQASGVLTIGQGSGTAIDTDGQMNNFGQVYISNHSKAVDLGFSNVSNSGYISIDSCQFGFLLYNGSFANVGDVEISNTVNGIILFNTSNSNSFLNGTQGMMSFSNVPNRLNMFDNNTSFVNQSGASIYYDSLSIGLNIEAGAIYENRGVLDLLPD